MVQLRSSRCCEHTLVVHQERAATNGKDATVKLRSTRCSEHICLTHQESAGNNGNVAMVQVLSARGCGHTKRRGGLTRSRATRSGVQSAHADVVLTRSKRKPCPSACHCKHDPRGHNQRTVARSRTRASVRAARVNIHPLLHTSKLVCSTDHGQPLDLVMSALCTQTPEILEQSPNNNVAPKMRACNTMNSGAQDYAVDEWSLRQIPEPHETN